MIGRLTGSEEWRQSRGETGGVNKTPHHSFRPGTSCDRMTITYNCATNEYTHDNTTIHGWDAGKICGNQKSPLNLQVYYKTINCLSYQLNILSNEMLLRFFLTNVNSPRHYFIGF